MKSVGKLFLIVLLLATFNLNAQLVTTFSGSAGIAGFFDGSSTSSRYSSPYGITTDKLGNIYVADRLNNRIRKIDALGNATTYAGSGIVGSTDGSALSATFNEPWAVACDTLGNIYVADTKNYKIRKIDSTGIVSTIAGTGIFGTTNGPAAIARFGFSCGITVTPDGNTIYVSDYNTHVIRKINGGIVTNFAGTIYISGSTNGAGITATFNHPLGLCLDSNNDLYIADEWNHLIRKVTHLGIVSTYSGTGLQGSTDGMLLTTSYNFPNAITADSWNNFFVTDGGNQAIRRINTSTSNVSLYCGGVGLTGSVDGTGTAARFSNPAGISFNTADQALYICDTDNETIRKVTAVSSIVLAVALVGPNTFCFGDSIKVTVSPGNLSNYKIFDNGTQVATGNNGTITIAPLSAGIHILSATAIDGIGAIASSNFTSLTVRPQFTPTIISSNGSALCNGSTTVLTAQTGIAYLWSTNAVTNTISVNTAGTYQVTVTNSNGCKGISSPFVVTNQTQTTPVISPAGSLNVCLGDSIVLTSTPANSYNWSNGNTTQTISVPAGSYTVTVSNSNGCSATSLISTVTNYLVAPIQISPPGPIVLLQGDSSLLLASGGSNYLWSNGVSATSIYVNSSGNYSATCIDVNGCAQQSNTVNVTIIAGQTNLTASGPTTFCEGGNVVLSTTSQSGNQWYYNNQLILGETNQTYTVVDSGYYKASFILLGNTVFTDSILVNVLPAPLPPFVTDTTICSGNSVLLSIAAVTGLDYKWYDESTGGNVLALGTSFQTPPLSASISFYIEAMNSNNCISLTRSMLNAIVKESPKISYTYSTQALGGEFNVSFINTSTNSDYYIWMFGDTLIAGNISYDINPNHSYSNTGQYPVTVYASNSFGCTSLYSNSIYVKTNNALFIPTTFTPNGDGKNDIFRVRGDQFLLKEMAIYDQWGTLVYRTDASLPYWDGKSQGDVLQNATYVYRINLIDQDQVSKELTGSITLIK